MCNTHHPLVESSEPSGITTIERKLRVALADANTRTNTCRYAS
jgi:hypothetical protein